MPIERIQTGPRMSQAVIHNGTIYLAGQVASGKPGASVTEQTQDILGRIDVLLSAAGTDKTRLLSATIWLVDMASFPEMNAVWEAWVASGAAPARATVASPQLVSPDYKIEIAVTAATA
jgi:enamine deaminase RidA (YjgF/YER057c/UK114 family)